jgi:hypothetical protein
MLAPVGELLIRLTGVETVSGGGGGVRVAEVNLGSRAEPLVIDCLEDELGVDDGADAGECEVESDPVVLMTLLVLESEDLVIGGGCESLLSTKRVIWLISSSTIAKSRCNKDS